MTEEGQVNYMNFRTHNRLFPTSSVKIKDTAVNRIGLTET